MVRTATRDRDAITRLVTSTLRETLSQRGGPERLTSDSPRLFGRDGLLDSLGLVTLIVDLEQKLDESYGVSVTLADDRAMSQRSSPFRTVETLTDYICDLIEEPRA